MASLLFTPSYFAAQTHCHKGLLGGSNSAGAAHKRLRATLHSNRFAFAVLQLPLQVSSRTALQCIARGAKGILGLQMHSKAFSRPFKCLSKAFQRPSKGEILRGFFYQK